VRKASTMARAALGALATLAVAAMTIGAGTGDVPRPASSPASAPAASDLTATAAAPPIVLVAAKSRPARPRALTVRKVTLTLMSGRRVAFKLPAAPLGTTKSITDGVNLEVWAAQRSAGGVTVVYALDDVSGGDISTDGSGDVPVVTVLSDALASDNGNYADDGASNVGLFDATNLTEYQTFCQVASDGTLSDCLDSADDVSLEKDGARQYFAAVVAAPPASATSATVVTGVGSVPDVPISG
jgi:hypothetical protein